MAMHYGCVAQAETKTIIVDRSNDSSRNYRAVVHSMLPNVSAQEGKKFLYLHKSLHVAVLMDHGLIYICVTSPDFEVARSFAFLEELAESFSDPKNNNLREPNVHQYDSVDGITEDRENATPTVAVVDGSGVKRAKKLSHDLAKKMKHFSKVKKIKKSKKIRVPKTGQDVEPLITPASKHMANTFVPMQSEQPLLVNEKENGYSQGYNRCQNLDSTGEKIQHLQRAADEVRDIMNHNIERVLTRGENLEELLERANDLEAAACEFQKTSKLLKRKFIWRNRRVKIGIVIVSSSLVLMIGAVIFVVVCFEI